MSSKRKDIDVSDDTAKAVVTALAQRDSEYKPDDRRKPTLRDFLSKPTVYNAIKAMLDKGLPWSEIAAVVNETQGTHLKPSTISGAFGSVAKDKGEPRKEAVARQREQRRQAAAEAAAEAAAADGAQQ